MPKHEISPQSQPDIDPTSGALPPVSPAAPEATGDSGRSPRDALLGAAAGVVVVAASVAAGRGHETGLSHLSAEDIAQNLPAAGMAFLGRGAVHGNGATRADVADNGPSQPSRAERKLEKLQHAQKVHREIGRSYVPAATLNEEEGTSDVKPGTTLNGDHPYRPVTMYQQEREFKTARRKHKAIELVNEQKNYEAIYGRVIRDPEALERKIKEGNYRWTEKRRMRKAAKHVAHIEHKLGHATPSANGRPITSFRPARHDLGFNDNSVPRALKNVPTAQMHDAPEHTRIASYDPLRKTAEGNDLPGRVLDWRIRRLRRKVNRQHANRHLDTRSEEELAAMDLLPDAWHEPEGPDQPMLPGMEDLKEKSSTRLKVEQGMGEMKHNFRYNTAEARHETKVDWQRTKDTMHSAVKRLKRTGNGEAQEDKPGLRDRMRGLADGAKRNIQYNLHELQGDAEAQKRARKAEKEAGSQPMLPGMEDLSPSTTERARAFGSQVYHRAEDRLKDNVADMRNARQEKLDRKAAKREEAEQNNRENSDPQNQEADNDDDGNISPERFRHIVRLAAPEVQRQAQRMRSEQNTAVLSTEDYENMVERVRTDLHHRAKKAGLSDSDLAHITDFDAFMGQVDPDHTPAAPQPDMDAFAEHFKTIKANALPNDAILPKKKRPESRGKGDAPERPNLSNDEMKVLLQLDRDVYGTIKQEAHDKAKSRGIDALPDDDFAELVTDVRNRLYREKFGQNLTDEDIKGIGHQIKQVQEYLAYQQKKRRSGK